MSRLFMVFDVESVGLHGEGFSVGWIVVDADKNRIITSAQYACDPARAKGTDESREWLAKNVPVPRQGYNCSSPRGVRDEFWRAWQYGKTKGALLVADCCWPVEARFLVACVDDDPKEREWDGPYPLHDVASIILANGGDPMVKHLREPEELPEHDPMADARQSARLLLLHLK